MEVQYRHQYYFAKGNSKEEVTSGHSGAILNQASAKSDVEENQEPVIISNNLVRVVRSFTFLMTAIGVIANSFVTKSKKARILFDQGAVKSFIIETFSKFLNLLVVRKEKMI